MSLFGGESDDALTRKPPPAQRIVDWFHGRASTNKKEDLHHKLGYGPGEAAPGEDVRAFLLGKNVPGFSGLPWDSGTGLRYMQTVRYTSSGTFTKSDYPGLKAMRVRVQAPGGAGGGSAASSGARNSKGGGGGGGGYAERFITDIDSLDAIINVTIGVPGAGTPGAGGGTGGTTSFGSLCVATGGSGGSTVVLTSVAIGAQGGAGGIGTVGDILIGGGAGSNGFGSGARGMGGTGGSSVLGGGGSGQNAGSDPQSLRGAAGRAYGGGGGGAVSTGSGAAAAGGAGGAGIVIVELYG